MTFLLNCVVVAVFLGIGGIQPQLDWLLIVPLLLELYLFVLAIALIVSALYVRFRDVGQIWEVTISLLFFSAPIMYPITTLPPWAQRIVSLNPFVQVMQNVRTLILGPGSAPLASRFAPILIAAALFGLAVWLFRRESPRFAERA
jgi:ABC-2 type transport system permease protein